MPPGGFMRALKGMFKRSKKSKQDEEKPAASQQDTAPAMKRVGTTPPRLPPIENASPLGSANGTSKPLPPTHPLSTGRHEERQEAVPQNHPAQPGPLGGTSTLNNTEAVTPLEEQDSTARESLPVVSPLVIDGTKSDVPTVEDDAAPPPPPKKDSAIESAKQEEHVATSQSPASKENVPSTATATAEEPTVNGTTTTHSPITEPIERNQPNVVEDKIVVEDEPPPPIKAVRAAPGMSATSGPLEDFPEGGY